MDHKNEGASMATGFEHTTYEKGLTGPPAYLEKRTSDSDVETGGIHEAGEPVHLQRRLQSRHLQMIAMGGTIGTGLFIGSGGALASAGPVGALIAFIFVGTIVFSVMVGLGEVATFLPIGSFTVFPSRLLDDSLGFSTSWIYWFSWAMCYALELTASGLIIQYWTDANIGIFIGVFWLVITLINMFPVSIYGEIEFWFSLIKIVTVLGFLIFGICIDAGAGGRPYLGFYYWVHPNGPFAAATDLIPDPNQEALAKFVGFWSTLITAGFSYQGTELVGIAAGETANPRKNVPSAIRKTFWRILFFFVGTVFFIGLLIPSDNPNLASSGTSAKNSPLVIAAQLAGVSALPSIINAVLLTVVLSAANSNVYSGSRILVGLADDGFAPKFFKRTTRSGVPYIAVSFTAVFGLLGFLNESDQGGNVFNWLLNITVVAGFLAWVSILCSALAFMRACKAQGISRDSLPYKAPLQPWLSYYGLFFVVLIVITQGFTAFIPSFSVTDFFIAYVSLILFVVLYIGHKLYYRSPFIKPHEVDLDSGRREVEEMYAVEVKPTTFWGKFWDWLA